MNEEKKLVPKLRFPEFRGAGEWVQKKLGDEGALFSSLTGKAGADFDAGKARFVTYMNVFSNAFVDPTALRFVDVKEGENQNAVASGDVFFTISSETPDEVGMSSVLLEDLENCYLNSFCALFRFSEDKRPNPVFTGYLLRQPLVRDYFTKKAQGSTRFNLSKDAFRSLPLCVPSPAEQQKIADCLSSLDELIAAQARKVDALKAYKRGLMQQLFPREGEAQPRLRFPEFREAGEWEVGLLGQFAQVNPLRETRADDVNVSFVPMSAVSEDGHLVSPQIREYGSVKKGFTAFRNKDVIVAKITPCFENGKAALVTGLMDGIGFGSTEFHVVRASNACLPEFLFAQIYSDQFRRLGKSSMTGSGGQQRVPTAFVENYLVSIPSLAEQQRIADCLTSLDTLITASTQELETLKTHKKGLMQQLFPSAEAMEA